MKKIKVKGCQGCVFCIMSTTTLKNVCRISDWRPCPTKTKCLPTVRAVEVQLEELKPDWCPLPVTVEREDDDDKA